MRCKACLLVRRVTNKAPLSRHAECRDVMARTCCHRLAGGCGSARMCQRRRALLVWRDVSLAPLTFTSRLSGCCCSRRRRFRAAECKQWQHDSDRLRASWACIPLPCSQSACCNSRPALTFTWGFVSFNDSASSSWSVSTQSRTRTLLNPRGGPAPGGALRGGLGCERGRQAEIDDRGRCRQGAALSCCVRSGQVYYSAKI